MRTAQWSVYERSRMRYTLEHVRRLKLSAALTLQKVIAHSIVFPNQKEYATFTENIITTFTPIPQ